MLSSRQLEILEFIILNMPVTAQDVADKLTLSARTIRDELKRMTGIVETEGLAIAMVPRVGILVHSLNSKSIQENCEAILKHHNSVFNIEKPEDRAHQIILSLLNADSYIKIETFAQRYFVDRTSISKDMKYVRSCLLEFNISIENKPHYGVRIVGEEFDIRRCLIEYGFYSSNILEIDFLEAYHQNEARVRDVLLDDGISMSDVSLRSLVYHCLVSRDRIQAEHPVRIDSDQQRLVRGEYERLVAKDIIKALAFPEEVRAEEIDYIAMHIISKKYNTISEMESCINNEIKPSIRVEIEIMLEHVYSVFGINLLNDQYLIKTLGLHYKQMMQRINFRLLQRNVLREEIKEKYTLSYLIAYEMLKHIGIKNNVLFNENEASFLALHIEYAMERMTVYTKRLLLVNDYSSTNNELLQFQINAKLGNAVEIVDVTTSSALKDYDLKDVDIIITTNEKHLNVNREVIQIQPILQKADLSHLEKRLKPSQNKEDMNIEYFNNKEYEAIAPETFNREGMHQNQYYLEAFVLRGGILIKPILVDTQSKIAFYELSDAQIYKSNMITKIVIMEMKKGSIRRTLRNMHEGLQKSL